MSSIWLRQNELAHYFFEKLVFLMIFGSVGRWNQNQYTSNPSKEDLATGLVIAQGGHNMKRLLSPAVLKMAPARDYQPRVKSQNA